MAEEWFVDDPRVRRFVEAARPIFGADTPIEERLAQARPLFRDLLLQDGWLPEAFQRGDERSGMGGKIGTWLLYRGDAPEMTLFSLVVESGGSTPVHDHLRWGLVGVHQGEQLECVYAPEDDGGVRLSEERTLVRGDNYDLIPPADDIHSVVTLSDEPSISIHLLGGDIGCIWRHRFDLEHHHTLPFRSGYSNMPCADAEPIVQAAR